MIKFITVPVNDEKCIINLNSIQCITPIKDGSVIHLVSGSLTSIRTQMPYEELCSLIQYVTVG